MGEQTIRVVTAYTLHEVFDRVWNGDILVEAVSVILDVATNDIRGTRRQPRAMPEEIVERLGRMMDVLKRKGAGGVICLRGQTNDLCRRPPLLKLHPPQMSGDGGLWL